MKYMEKTSPEIIEAAAKECAEAAMGRRKERGTYIKVEASKLPPDTGKMGYKSALALYVDGVFKRVWAFMDEAGAEECGKLANTLYKKMREDKDYEKKEKVVPPINMRSEKGKVGISAEKAEVKVGGKGKLSALETLRLKIAERRMMSAPKTSGKKAKAK